MVASADNDGPACSTVADAPALYAEAFAVGAVDCSGSLAAFSSRGPVTADGSGRVKPDVVAPGVGVVSAFPGNTYEAASGTSMAGPHVAGVVALLWSANPALIGDIERTEQILTQSAWPLQDGNNDDPMAAEGIVCGLGGDDIVPNDYTGYGMVDALKAIQLALGQP